MQKISTTMETAAKLLSNPKLKCVIFDMDGVIYDSMPFHATEWVKCLQDCGIPFTEREVYLNEGRTGKSTIELAFRKYLKREATEHEIKTIYQTKIDSVQNYPDAPFMHAINELIFDLQQDGIATWVVTGSQQPSLLQRLTSVLNIPQDQIVSAKDVIHGKPHPEPYLLALQRSGYHADECVVIENAPLGVQSARAALISTIAVNTGLLDKSDLANADANVVLSSIKELFDAYQSIRK